MPGGIEYQFAGNRVRLASVPRACPRGWGERFLAAESFVSARIYVVTSARFMAIPVASAIMRRIKQGICFWGEKLVKRFVSNRKSIRPRILVEMQSLVCQFVRDGMRLAAGRISFGNLSSTR